MNLFAYFHDKIAAEIAALGFDLDTSRMSVEPPRDPSHGDVSANAAMVLAKGAGMKPRDFAEKLRLRLAKLDHVTAAEVAGPGFINLRLDADFWYARLAEILRAGPSYGDSTAGEGRTVNVEYVSANPTGPMHVGHGRGAVVGDALAALLHKSGHAVTREYYVNDAGAQVDALARSVHLRYRQALGETVGEIPDGLYLGEYLVETGATLARRDAKKWLGRPESEWLAPVRDFAVEEMLTLIRGDLERLGIVFDVFSSERRLVKAGAIEQAISELEKQGLIYVGTLEPPKGMLPEDWEARPQTLFRSTAFGDDVDRPIKKADGSWTYFAADIAYHWDKVKRGFADLIDVWGADHGGYVKRMQAAVKALTQGKAALDVKLCQLVNLSEAGQPVRMSKRAGTFVTLREVIERVGKDVVRFVMLTRRNDQTLDFDFAKVVEQSKDNPVFYVQYAHARARSVMRLAAQHFGAGELTPAALSRGPLALLADADELALVRQLAQWPRTVEGASQMHEPHRIAFYLQEIAASFHALWNKGNADPGLRFVVESRRDLTRARLALVQAVAFVVASGLKVIGVTPAEELR
ncbi:MAG: arginine--tRNA ligase [Alphaproteobacteria bacterium]|nr:arginine--tRNA ligase [Alphaproteobacteria bacterium]